MDKVAQDCRTRSLKSVDGTSAGQLVYVCRRLSCRDIERHCSCFRLPAESKHEIGPGTKGSFIFSMIMTSH